MPTWGTAAGGAESLWGHADAGAMAPAQGGPAVDAAGIAISDHELLAVTVARPGS